MTDSESVASQIYWRWLLKKVRLTSMHAAMHKVYQKDSAAVFYDLNGDGENEILATHFSTATTGRGECLLYILKKDKDGYKEISRSIYFNPALPVYILPQKTDGFYDIETRSLFDVVSHKWMFSKKQGVYVRDSGK